MKNAITISFLLITISLTSQHLDQFIWNNLSGVNFIKSTENMKLLGDIKSVKETIYEAADSSGVILAGKISENDDEYNIYDYTFDEKGLVLRQAIFNHDSSNIFITSWTFNKDGLPISKTKEETDSARCRSWEFSYNDKMMKTGSKEYDIFYKLVKEESWKYNKMNEVIEGTKRIIKDDQIWKYNWTYDDKGNNTHFSWYKEDGKLLRKELYKYNEGDQMILYVSIGPDNTVISKVEYEYDKEGQKISETTIWPEKGSQSYTRSYKYDDKGNVIEYSGTNSDGTTDRNISYELTYDEQGNWINKVIYFEDVPQKVVIRDIVYY